ncbi:MAG: AI-2E family transporter, partial [Rhodospirillaceae bacterium]|nr:AI-2E family transporter [Rhodospirillaceae bacterium]
HIFFGMIIGGLIALGGGQDDRTRPLARALGERAAMLARAFRRVVFAQAQISAVNTVLTGLYLAGILPLFGVHLPFLKTLIVLTFVVGLLPIIGNLVSNTVIIIMSLAVSLYAAIASLLFLVLIHKLEYFVNARLMGRHLQARAWELLLAMLVMDAAFGLPGLVAAPIYYGYLKDELSARQLV